MTQVVSVNINNKEITKAIKNISKYSKRVSAGVKRQVATTAINIESKTKLNLTRQKAVDTGNLRASYRAKFSGDGLGAEVGTNVEYGPHIEFGTFKMAARPSLFPAAEQERSNYINGITEVLR